MFLKKINIKNVLIIVLSAVILGFLYNGLSGHGINVIYEEKTYQKYSENVKTISSEAKLLNLDQTMDFYFNKGYQFIDARDGWDFAESHIPGAINIPEYSFDPVAFNEKGLKKDESYVIYCGGDDCDISKRLADELVKLGFTHLYIFEAGFSEWQKLELPVESK